MIITITTRLNRDEGAKELFGYESDRRRHLLICTNCLRESFCIPATSLHQWTRLQHNPCSHTVHAWATGY